MSLIVNHLRSHFDSVWGVDFEYNTGDSEADAPKPICMVAHELFTGASIRKWLWDGTATECPIPTDDRSLYVAFYASAEITCHLGLGWPIPARILDLYAEFRCVANSLANFQVTSVKGKTRAIAP
jgi:DNA polymerase-1